MRTISFPWYLTISAGVILVGLLFTFEGGIVLVLLGLTLVLLAPLRRHRRLFSPALSAVALFLVTFMLTIPLNCSFPVDPAPGSGFPETCRSIIGVTQTRFGGDVALAPLITIGALVAIGGFLAMRRALRPNASTTG